jgi:hypothetical protein
MLVWQTDGERWADTRQQAGGQTHQRTGGQARVRPYVWSEDEIWRRSGWQLSAEIRVALEFAMAIGCALGSSWLLLRLGL